MSFRKVICLVGIALCAAFLGVSFTAINPWIGLCVLLIVLSFWGFAYGRLSPRLILSALLGSLAIAAIGLIAGAVPLEMFCSASFALASWDLLNLELSLSGQEPVPANNLLVRKHIQSLGLSIGIAFLIYLGGRFLQIPAPFGAILILAALALLGIDQLWRLISI